MKFETIDELLNYTKGIIGKTFKEIDFDNKLQKGLLDKGILGKIIETGFYKYKNNNHAEADFNNLGVELKVTGYIKNKNGTVSAKERLVLGKIDYFGIINEDFDFSKLIFKNKKILIIWYEYDKNKNVKDFVITDYQLYDMSDDELIIKNDFEIIKEKVLLGKAHLLSEGDTSYLGACVKGVDGSQKVLQPNSDIGAKPRAFSLKNSYLTGILRSSNLVFEIDNLEYKSVEDYVYAQIKKYIGRTQLDIYEELFGKTIDNIPKNIGKIISDTLIGKDEELPDKSSLFTKTNYKIKNIPVDKNFKPLERMPFRTLRLHEFDVEWEDSDWKRFFEEVTIITLCYEGTKEAGNGYRVLKDIRKIVFNDEDVESFGKTYRKIQEAIEKHDTFLLPYPNSFENQKLEIAPKGQKGANAYKTFFSSDKTKVCFMLNKDFVYSKLIENEVVSVNTSSEFEDNNHDSNQLENCNNVRMTDYNIFQLFDYGISKSVIMELAEKRVPPYNIFLNGVSELDSFDMSLSRKNKICDAVNKMISCADTKRNIFELSFVGSVSKNSIDNLIAKNIDIDTVKENDIVLLQNKYGLGEAFSKKIKKIVEEVDSIISQSNENLSTTFILERVIKNNASIDYISVFKLKQLLSKNSEYCMENFNKDYNILLQSGKISIGLYGICYNVTTFEEYIKNNFDDRLAEILIKRFWGNTLESIATTFGITRERVRQLCNKLNLDKISVVLREDKYKEIFEKYNWDSASFNTIFDESMLVFNYLNERYTKGSIETSELLNDSYFTEEQKTKYRISNKFVITEDGEVISNLNEFIKKVMIQYAKDEINVTDLTDIYNNEIEKYPELQLSTISVRNLEARLSRCDYAFFGSNHMVRYYDFNELSEQSIDQLKELIIMDDGFYTTEYIFRNNLPLMRELDIRNENELHNILKLKIDNDSNNVTFLRMPNFLVEYKEKDDFIIDKIREYAPITINDFIDMLYEEYGHKKNTMLSYLLSNFSTYIFDGVLEIETIDIEIEEINLLKTKLNKDIYIIDELKAIFEDCNLVSAKLLTNRNLFKLGYKLRGSYAISAKYNNIYGYLDYKIANEKIIKLDKDIVRIGSIYNAIYYFCKNLMLFKLTDDIFITSSKLEELGISKKELLTLIDNVRELFGDYDYFTINNIYSELDCSKFEKLGLSSGFIEDMLFYLDDIRTLRINNIRMFSFSNKHLSIAKFMNDMINKYVSITLNDLEKEILRVYQVDIPFEKLRGYLYNTDIFYSDILEKIYLDKNDYYEEVYDE